MSRPVEFGFDDEGNRVSLTPFPFDQVDQDLSGYEPEVTEKFTAREVQMAMEVIDRLLTWIWQCGMLQPEGLKIRAIVACWALLKPLRVYNLTEMARLYGKKKQSLGRWVEEFKREFDFLSPHMHSFEPRHGRAKFKDGIKVLRTARLLRRVLRRYPSDRWPKELRRELKQELDWVAEFTKPL